MEWSSEYPPQEQELVYALDIGTRSVIGVLAKREQDRMHVLMVEKQPHRRRAMLDGQIENIHQVTHVVQEVTQRLEERSRRKLTRACVAAAGRALRAERGHSRIELPAPEIIQAERIEQLELDAVSDAEHALREADQGEQRMFLVGYTVTQLQLDRYPLTSLEGHTGQLLEADVVATFLPSEVIDSLYAVMREAGLEVASLTLEPIAALNAAIPEDIRLLNLALVDIGAGTSDIALCRDGSVVGYTMATVAGDEITEALMRECLVSYSEAEEIKLQLGTEERVTFTDVVGMEQTRDRDDLLASIRGEIQGLADEIARRVLEVNGKAPSALFLAGGGSKLARLEDCVAEALGMDRKRVAVAGRYVENSAYSDAEDLTDPELTTPLGIAISAGLGLISDSYQVVLNDRPAKLFRSGRLTVRELLMMNGYTYSDLIGRSGKSRVVQVDGRRRAFYGEPAVPAQLRINGAEAQPSQVIHAGDVIQFIPAQAGRDSRPTAGELQRELGVSDIWCGGRRLKPEEELLAGMELETGPKKAAARDAEPTKPAAPISPAAASVPTAPLQVELNGAPLTLPGKPDGAPYYLMDLLERSGIDFDHVKGRVRLSVNGGECTFQQILKQGDKVEIRYES